MVGQHYDGAWTYLREMGVKEIYYLRRRSLVGGEGEDGDDDDRRRNVDIVKVEGDWGRDAFWAGKGLQ